MPCPSLCPVRGARRLSNHLVEPRCSLSIRGGPSSPKNKAFGISAEVGYHRPWVQCPGDTGDIQIRVHSSDPSLRLRGDLGSCMPYMVYRCKCEVTCRNTVIPARRLFLFPCYSGYLRRYLWPLRHLYEQPAGFTGQAPEVRQAVPPFATSQPCPCLFCFHPGYGLYFLWHPCSGLPGNSCVSTAGRGADCVWKTNPDRGFRCIPNLSMAHMMYIYMPPREEPRHQSL